MNNLDAQTKKEELESAIVREILSGGFAIGEKLPAERKLAEKYGVSRAVINPALKELAEKKFVRIVPRTGAFVENFPEEGNASTLAEVLKYRGNFSSEMMAQLTDFFAKLAKVISLPSGSASDALAKLIEKVGKSASPSEAGKAAYLAAKEAAKMTENTATILLVSACSETAKKCLEYVARQKGTSYLQRRIKELILGA